MRHYPSLWLGLVAAAINAVPAVAQDATRPAPTTPQRTATQQTDRAAASQIDSVTQGATFRASQLTGMSIQNNAGKDVGDINDLVIDANTGKIRYVAVTYGGFLGIGDKMFAVPFEAFKFRRNPQAADETLIVLNVTEQQLEGATGFDQDKWPDFGNAAYTQELDRRYNVKRQQLPDRGDVKIEGERKRERGN